MSRPSDLVQGTNGSRLTSGSNKCQATVAGQGGSQYPALHKLGQEGWMKAEWKTSEHGGRAKYYSLTRLGRRQLEKQAGNWSRLSSAISRIIRLEQA